MYILDRINIFQFSDTQVLSRVDWLKLQQSLRDQPLGDLRTQDKVPTDKLFARFQTALQVPRWAFVWSVRVWRVADEEQLAMYASRGH